MHQSNSSRKFINASCIVYVVSGVTNFDFSGGYQNNHLKNKEKPKKYVSFTLLFKQCFILNDGLYSGYLLNFSRRTTVPTINPVSEKKVDDATLAVVQEQLLKCLFDIFSCHNC